MGEHHNFHEITSFSGIIWKLFAGNQEFKLCVPNMIENSFPPSVSECVGGGMSDALQPGLPCMIISYMMHDGYHGFDGGLII